MQQEKYEMKWTQNMAKRRKIISKWPKKRDGKRIVKKNTNTQYKFTLNENENRTCTIERLTV